MLSYFVNYGVNQSIPSTSATQWRIPFALQMLPGALLLSGIFFQSESPRWLVEKNRISDARKSLAHIRSRPQDDPEVDSELEAIVEDFNGHEKMPLLAQIRATCKDGKVFYTFSMGVVLMFWQQWTGTNSINYCELLSSPPDLTYLPLPSCENRR